MGRGALERLSKAELIELVVRLRRPEKTSRPSSQPPSTDRSPALWLSDRYAAQQGHGVAHQTGLAPLARDLADAVEASDDPVPWRLPIWLDAVFALAGRVTSLAASTLAAKRRPLDRHLAGILTTASRCDLT